MVKGLMILWLALLLGACSSVMSASSYCRIYKPILISKKDQFTPRTARQILTENEKHKGICDG